MSRAPKKPLNWREHPHREAWYTGPSEGRTYFRAKRGGITYRVQASWAQPLYRTGPVIWCGQAFPANGAGITRCWKTKEAAIAWCEAGAPPKHPHPTREAP